MGKRRGDIGVGRGGDRGEGGKGGLIGGIVIEGDDASMYG